MIPPSLHDFNSCTMEIFSQSKDSCILGTQCIENIGLAKKSDLPYPCLQICPISYAEYQSASGPLESGELTDPATTIFRRARLKGHHGHRNTIELRRGTRS